MSNIGHNNPPSQIESSEEVAAALGGWLLANPVVGAGPAAVEGALHFDRARLYLADLDAERKVRVEPLNKQVAEINDEYRQPRAYVEKLRKLVGERLNVWRATEEDKRRQEVEEISRRAAETERQAREAEAREREAAEDARLGVEVDVAAVTQAADTKFAEHQSTQRELARAQNNITPKVRGVTGRTIATRFEEELVIKNADVALRRIGWSERMLDALIKEARAYRKRCGSLPDGIASKGERTF